jgi:transcription antitermination factor NusG
LTPHEYLKTGQKCRVIAGPLLGLQGVVVKTRGAMRLVLQVDMLGQAASVEIDIDMIEVVD